MPNVLIIGATRGLGASLAQKYATENNCTVFATSRSENVKENNNNVTFVPGIDLTLESNGAKLVSYLKEFKTKLDIVIITAGYFGTETFDEPRWEEEIKMQVYSYFNVTN
jgi:short-subunit dehydrogenase